LDRSALVVAPVWDRAPAEAPARDPISGRVFGVGLNKTGTSSLKEAFVRLGMLPVTSERLAHRAGLTEAILERSDYEPALRYARLYRCFEDRPWNVWQMYRRLDERFPESSFVLTVRDPRSWWRSTHRWITVVKPWMAERYRLHLRAETLSESAMVEGYLRYNREVVDYFAGRDDLLVLDLEAGQGWPELCRHLGCEAPLESFPHQNRQPPAENRPALVALSPRAGAGRSRPRGPVEECARCHLPMPGPAVPLGRRLSTAVPEWAKRAYRRLQHRAFVTPDGAAVRERRLAGLRERHPNLNLEDMAVVCCVFNPCGYRSRVANYRRFRESLAGSGLPLLTVELALRDDPFQLGDRDGEILRVRGRDALWQKERLLNLGIRELLSRGYRKIVWLDADILFDDVTGWPWYVAAELERSSLCQVFGQVLVEQEGGRTILPGISAVRYLRLTGEMMDQDRLLPSLRHPYGLPLGYTGFGWAARAEVLAEVGLYDAAVVGGGDKLIYAASFGTDERWCARASRLLEATLPPCPRCGHLGAAPEFFDHYVAWARRWSRAVTGRVGFADQTVRSLYHGNRHYRRYQSRRDTLLRHAFDPRLDLTVEPDGCWAWSSRKPDLHLEVWNYLFERREDL
jgi:hypothetical protein